MKIDATFETIFTYAVVFGCLIASLFVGYLIGKKMAEMKGVSAKRVAQRLIEDAEREAETKKKDALLEVKDMSYRMQVKFEQKTRAQRQELEDLQKTLSRKEAESERKADLLDKKDVEIVIRDRRVAARERGVDEVEKRLKSLQEEQKRQLERISGLSRVQAKRMFLSTIAKEAKQEAATMVRGIEIDARQTAERKARNIIGLAIQRCAVDHTTESTVSTVSLPSDDMKGRIIGREGRNIRALEATTGVDIIIDDTPEAVVLSGFDPVRREIARISLERLIQDGRIHPARIEEVVAKVKSEIETTIQEAGQEVVDEIGITEIHPELIRFLGKLKYRTSYGQNVLQHSKEVAYLAGLMAAELGDDVSLARRAGLLHDIGKAVDREAEGVHAKIGADLAARFNEPESVIHAIACHHEDEEPRSVIAVLVLAADAISAARPGVRRETLESYIKRLKQLEHIADSFAGVEKSYAIQAGREIRIMVESEEVDDAACEILARDVAKKIKAELEYPGQIKVTVIREKRVVEYAK